MSEESKDRLEEFFRKNTEKYHFEYSDADWKKLEAKLDEVERGGGAPVFKRNGMKYYLFGGLLILSLALWFGVNKMGNTGDENISHQDNLAGTYAPQDTSPKAEKEMPTFSDRGNKTLPAQAEPRQGKRETSGEAMPSENELGAKANTENASSAESFEKSNAFGAPEKVADAELANKKTGTNEKTLPADDVVLPPGNEVNAVSATAFSKGKDDLNKEMQKTAWKIGNAYGSGFQKISSYGIAMKDLQTLAIDIVPADFTAQPGNNKGEIIEGGKNRRHLQQSFSVGFSVAPDFSTVGIGDYTRPGTRYGLVMEYSLSRRFIIRSGAIMADNIYKADGDEYHPPDSFWSGGETPETADGRCKIVDIPLNLRYNIAGGGKSRFFVSGGINNYIMLKEKYDFTYADKGYGEYGRKSSWESKKASSHWLGLVNFSAGYERFVAQKWSVQAEPFINFPITEIGWGNVDLYSLGAYLSLKYHWNKK